MTCQPQPPTEGPQMAPRPTETAAIGIQDRVLELLRAHIPFNDAVDEIGGELVLMFQCECQPNLTTEYKTADEWCAHVASVLVAELFAGCDCDGQRCSLAAHDDRHGSNNGYTNCGCRCTPCRAGHAAEKRERESA